MGDKHLEEWLNLKTDATLDAVISQWAFGTRAGSRAVIFGALQEAVSMGQGLQMIRDHRKEHDE